MFVYVKQKNQTIYVYLVKLKQQTKFSFSDYLMEYSTHVFIQQTPITEQNFELK